MMIQTDRKVFVALMGLRAATGDTAKPNQAALRSLSLSEAFYRTSSAPANDRTSWSRPKT